MEKENHEDNQEKDLTRKIKERAFRIWVEEGQPAGREREHWSRAKAEVLACQPDSVPAN
jgi:hypothetical protein